jgi:hypothetical protein
MMTKVKCTVDSCEFWGEGQVCTAEEIWVRNDISGDPNQFHHHLINASPVEFGQDFSESEKKKPQEKLQSETAQTSPQTCCDTMRPKGHGSCGCGCK